MLTPFLSELHEITVSDPNLSATHLVLHHCQFEPGSDTPDELFKEACIQLPERLSNASNGRKTEYLAGRLCAAKALSWFDIPHVEVGSHDDRSPIWPEGVVGSISHKNNLAVAVVSKAHQYLGVDLEMTFKPTSATKIAKKIICDSEADLIEESQFDFATGLTVIFSAKEALYKAIYPAIKRYLPFHICMVEALSANHLILNLREDISKEVGCGATFYVYCHWQNSTVITLVAE